MFGLRRIADDTRLVAANHHRDTLDQVAKIITKFGVIGCLEFLPSKVAVVLRWDMACEEITERIRAIAINDFDRINHITDRLADLGTADIDETVDEQLARQCQAEAKEHRWPNTSMKTQYILADYLYVRRPIVLPAFLVRITKHRDIVRQRIEPHIHDLV